MTTTHTHYVVYYDTPNNRPAKRFDDVDAAQEFYTQKEIKQANPEMRKVTEWKIR